MFNYSVYAFWFSPVISETRKAALSVLHQSVSNLVLLNTPRFYALENQEIPIHRAFKYLTDVHKSDYARAYVMYFYGGGYSDVKPNSFDWKPYFDKLYSSEYDAIGYAEKNPGDIAIFYSDKETKDYVDKNYYRFMGNGHYIFKPKTDMAFKWITEIHQKLDIIYDKLISNPGITVHITDPTYKQLLKDYPLEWNEICGKILHKLQYEYRLENILTDMPFTNNVNYR